MVVMYWFDFGLVFSLALSDSARLCRMKLKSMNKKPSGAGWGGWNTARSYWGNATYNDLILCFLDKVRWHCILDLKQRRGFHLKMPLSQSNQTEGYLRTSYTNAFSPGLEFRIKSKWLHPSQNGAGAKQNFNSSFVEAQMVTTCMLFLCEWTA